MEDVDNTEMVDLVMEDVNAQLELNATEAVEPVEQYAEEEVEILHWL